MKTFSLRIPDFVGDPFFYHSDDTGNCFAAADFILPAYHWLHVKHGLEEL
jgi:hypothetical protein